MNIIQRLKRPFIWLKRIRHRCGYGVHSPFAFDLITTVFYEKDAYYAYARLKEQEKKLKTSSDSPQKVKRLLFRLVNRVQPTLLVDAGEPSAASLYLRAARKDIDYRRLTSPDEPILKEGETIDFLYLHPSGDPRFAECILNHYLPHTHEQSVFVVEGIHYSRPMKRLWKKIQENNRVFVTFDLYDLGILYFDSQKTKQHYIINF